MRKRILCTAVSAALLFSLTGCAAGDKPYVYYLNFKPEADAAWQQLAKEYTALTGVPVKIVTAASNSYSDTLAAQMNKTSPPTLFICGSEQDLESWDGYAYDLTGSKLAAQLDTDQYCLYGRDGALSAIGFCYEVYGLIVNIPLLERAGHSLDEIRSFASLKAAAEDIHARRDALGYDAFTSSGLDSSSSWRFSGHLANLPLYYQFQENGTIRQPAEISRSGLELYKNVWDLYIQNSTVTGGELAAATGNMAEEEFGSGKAVFYQNGSWEYAALTDPARFAMKPEDLTMIPIYCGAEGEENAGLCCGTQNYWTVNAKATQESIDATIDFLTWVVTAEDGKRMLEEQFGETPFKDSYQTQNVFFQAANDYREAGKKHLSWSFLMTPNPDVWRSGVTSALLEYSAGRGSWDAVETAFVSGWAYQYKLEHCIL